jgi:CcmD family protein
MDDATTISDAVKIAFAAVNFLVWTGLFLYLVRLDRKVRTLETDAGRETEGAP